MHILWPKARSKHFVQLVSASMEISDQRNQIVTCHKICKYNLRTTSCQIVWVDFIRGVNVKTVNVDFSFPGNIKRNRTENLLHNTNVTPSKVTGVAVARHKLVPDKGNITTFWLLCCVL